MKSVIEKVKSLLLDETLRRIDIYSAASCLGFLVSVIPFIIIILNLIPYTPLTEEGMLLTLSSLIPRDAFDFIYTFIESLKGGTDFVPFSVIVMLWSSSWMMIYIRHALNDINGCKEKQNYLFLRIIGTLFLLVGAAAIVMTSALNVLGGVVLEFLKTRNIIPTGGLGFMLKYRAFLVVALQTLIFTLMYCFIPSDKLRFRSQIPGALFTSVANYVFLYLFDFAMGSYISFSMYGSLATTVVIVLYFYFIFYFFFLGALVNRKISK